MAYFAQFLRPSATAEPADPVVAFDASWQSIKVSFTTTGTSYGGYRGTQGFLHPTLVHFYRELAVGNSRAS